ncbi:hypothetical protein AGIG_G12061 [Arapaima gigas]
MHFKVINDAKGICVLKTRRSFCCPGSAKKQSATADRATDRAEDRLPPAGHRGLLLRKHRLRRCCGRKSRRVPSRSVSGRQQAVSRKAAQMMRRL